jgi:hypothetical protein
MPTQYFSADAQSATNVTQGLAEQFRAQGYRVISMNRARAIWQEMGLRPSGHYPDTVAVRFGRRVGANLVAYPRLLGVGIPAARTATTAGEMPSSAVLLLRVLDTRTGRPIYCRQVGYAFDARRVAMAGSFLPQQAANGAARKVTQSYFIRVAGSREERGRRR